MHYAIPQSRAFHRNMPATLTGPADRWEAVKTLIDFGAWLFELGEPLREEHLQRDLVLVALLRRALVTAEGTRVLLAGGLEEPAVGLTRTLLDIELAMKLVTRDPTDRTALKLAAWHYLGGQKHGGRMLKSGATRESLARGEGGTDRVVAVTKSYAAFLRLPVFDSVRSEVMASRHWHGFDNVEDAFAAVDAETDYTVPYDVTSPFVHASNVDHDFEEVRPKADGGQNIVVRAFVQRDPERLRPTLGHTALRLHNIITMYVRDRGLEDVIADAVRRMEEVVPPSPEPGSLALGTLDGILAHVLAPFGGFDSLAQEEELVSAGEPQPG